MSVYFVRQGLLGNVKIGSTDNIVQRMRSLQTGQPVRLRLMRLFDGSASDEKTLHQRFKETAISGEWFRFHEDMLKDVGLREIEPPQIGRYGKNNWPEGAYKYHLALNAEILDAIGGADELARRCGVPPWKVGESYIQIEWFGAVLLVLNERGVQGVTYQMLADANNAAVDHKQELKEKQKERDALEREARWIRLNPSISPWWEVLPGNRSLLEAEAAD